MNPTKNRGGTQNYGVLTEFQPKPLLWCLSGFLSEMETFTTPKRNYKTSSFEKMF
jgi:hypothetical protein